MRSALRENTMLAGKDFPINVFHTTFEEHHHLPLHWHEHYEIILVERGSATLQIGSRRYEASAGDLYVVNGREMHGISAPSTPFVFYAIVFHPSLIGLTPTDVEAMGLPTAEAEGSRAFLTVPDPACEHDAKIRSVLDTLIAEFKGRLPGYQEAVQASARLLFTWLYRWYAEERDPANRLSEYSVREKRFRSLLLHVERHYDEPITLDQAAGIVHLSTYHFCKTFKRMTGMTFVQYVNRYRIQEAERLLLDSSLSVTEIADRVGCGSINAFSKLFKQIRGCSPKQLRAK